MSALVPDNKVGAIEALGAEVRIVGNSQDDAQREVDRLAGEMTAISPFDDAAVIAGQGTLGLEMMEDAPDLDTVLVPLSGGGLIAGVALAVKTANPDARVIGITMERGAAMAASLAAGHPVEVTEEPTLADSLGGGIGLDNRHTFAHGPRPRRRLPAGQRGRDRRRHPLRLRGGGRGDRGRRRGRDRGARSPARSSPRGPVGVVLTGKNIDPDLHRRHRLRETDEPHARGDGS